MTEEAKGLGVGIRNLARRIQEDNVRLAHSRIPNRNPLAVLHPDDFATLQAEMTPAAPIPAENGSREIAVRSVSRSALEVVALMRAALAGTVAAARRFTVNQLLTVVRVCHPCAG